jgi:uncharacterized protein YbjT (DUF2867 family)
VPALLEAGYRVRAASRSLDKAVGRPWAAHPAAEPVACDALDASSLAQACVGVDVIYYLVHSMNPDHADYEEVDRRAASLTARVARDAGVKRLVFLGGLGSEGDDLSPHLRSRHEVGVILGSTGVPVTELRAAMIIGSGSASFEILRYLVDRLPVMITPRWVRTPVQPISIRAVIGYLVGCLAEPRTEGEILEIGGPEVITYDLLMRIYAEEAGLPRRWVIAVPVLTPRLSSYWIHLVTPVPASIARPLALGLKNPVICRENRIRDLIAVENLTPRESIRLALENTIRSRRETHWSDAGGAPSPEAIHSGDPAWAGGARYLDRREIVAGAGVESVWSVLRSIGGENGWYHADGLWRLRGLLDRLVGGVGLRRGRRDKKDLRVGDALDFWRVAALEPRRRILLAAEMKLPGYASLEFELEDLGSGETRIIQTARFSPRGLFGLLYWNALLPLHGYVFSGMIKAIAAKAVEAESNAP